MNLQWLACYHGPHPDALEPSVVGHLQATADEWLRLCTGLRQLFQRHPVWHPAAASPGGAEASTSPTANVHALTAWALGALNEVRGRLSAHGAAPTGTGARFWLGFHHPDLSRAAMELALHAAWAAADTAWEASALDASLERLWQACRQHHPDYQAHILMGAAHAQDIPFLPYLPGTRYWQYGWGARGRVFLESASNADGALGAMWQQSKHTSKAFFKALGAPTPRHELVTGLHDLPRAAQIIGFPCVLKPIDSGGGKGVTAHIQTLADLEQAFATARPFSPNPLMVERHVDGDDHRLLVVEGRLLLALRRQASGVVGDGQRTVQALVAELNDTRSRNLVRSGYLRPVALDQTLRTHLHQQGLSLQSTPAAGQRVSLRSNANVSTGGTSTNVTDQVHPEVRQMAEQLARAAGLHAAGLDYITTDIRRSMADTGGAFIEFNLTPGLDVCLASDIDSVALAKAILGDSVGRIPVTLTIQPEPASAAASAKWAHSGHTAGMGFAWGTTAAVGGLRLQVEDGGHPWAAVHTALRHRSTEQLEILCSPEHLTAHGLPLDRLARVRLVGATLPTGWMRLLKRVGDEVVTEARPMLGTAPQ